MKNNYFKEIDVTEKIVQSNNTFPVKFKTNINNYQINILKINTPLLSGSGVFCLMVVLALLTVISGLGVLLFLADSDDVLG